MKIVENKRMTTIDKLQNGDIFFFDTYYIKIPIVSVNVGVDTMGLINPVLEKRNAVNLLNGELIYIKPEKIILIHKVESELIVNIG